MKLRRYQVDGRNQIARAFNGGTRRILYQLPTAAGKTLIFADLVREVAAAGLQALVLVHRDELLLQTSVKLQAAGVRYGFIAPGYPTTRHRVQIASVFTLVRRLDWLADFDPQLLVIDEAHHAPASTWRKIMEALPDADILGVTATPRRLDGKPLDDLFDQLICGPPIAKLIDDGWLAPCTVFTPPRGPNLSRVTIRAGDYAPDELAGIMSQRVIIRGAVEEYERLCAGKPSIAFCVNIDHSKRVARAFRAAGYAAEHVDGETPKRERRELIAALAAREINILSNCGLISEGLDVPGVEVAILLRPTKSLALYLQMVGRALRPGKDLAFVLDHAGNVYRHGLPTAIRRWSLAGKINEGNAHADGAATIRCPECGAVNPAGALQCEHCGAPLHMSRDPPPEDFNTRPLVEAIEAPTSDTELGAMSYWSLLQWCAGEDGRLRRDRLERAAFVRDYRAGWVFYNADKCWQDVWEAVKARPR